MLNLEPAFGPQPWISPPQPPAAQGHINPEGSSPRPGRAPGGIGLQKRNQGPTHKVLGVGKSLQEGASRLPGGEEKKKGGFRVSKREKPSYR